MALFRKGDRPATGAAAAAFSLLAVVLAFASLVVVANQDDNGGGGAAAAGATTVTLSEFKIEPAMISVPEGGAINVVNGGTVMHNLAVEGLKTSDLNPGESEVLDLSDLKAGTYDNVIRLLPPLMIDEGLLDEGLDVLDAALGSVAR